MTDLAPRPVPATAVGPTATGSALAEPVRDGTIALVSPRFGPGVVGGAEAVLADTAFGLAARGLPVEILTTCARDHFTWANEFTPGTELAEGSSIDHPVLVRRFLVERDTPGTDRDRIGDRILGGHHITIQDQQRWMNDSLRSSGLWDHVFDHGHRYRALVFAPYMFWTTVAVSAIHPERTILMPCLHDEPPAALDIFASMMNGAAGIWFLTDPERDLAHRLYQLPDRQAIVGASVETPSSYDPDRFRTEFGIEGPYVYYAGRREWGKGWDDLLATFGRYVARRRGRPALRLVTSGVGHVDVPPGLTGDVIDVGLLTDQQRDDAMAGAEAYLQPSALESFSRTVLEAMAASTLVVANGASAVVSWHVENAGAGLTYEGEAELIQCLDFVTDQPAAAAALTVDGPAYVRDRFQIDGVIDRMVDSLDRWFPDGGGRRPATEVTR
ncbi:MAG: glycosyltransferase family 4 protein [Actinomycetota bacterium]